MLAQETLKNKIAFYLQVFLIQILNIKQWTEFLAFVEKPLKENDSLFSHTPKRKAYLFFFFPPPSNFQPRQNVCIYTLIIIIMRRVFLIHSLE